MARWTRVQLQLPPEGRCLVTLRDGAWSFVTIADFERLPLGGGRFRVPGMPLPPVVAWAPIPEGAKP